MTDHEANDRLFLALNNGDRAGAAAALAGGADPNAANVKGYSALHVALLAKKPDTEIVRQLLEAGADPCLANKNGDSALHEAAKFDDTSFLERLLPKAANLNGQNALGMSPLLNAVDARNEKASSLLLAAGADPSLKTPMGLSAILLACRRHHPGILRLLIGAGCDIEDGDQYGVTCLNEAVDYNPRFDGAGEKQFAAECAQLLLDFGANPDKAARSGTRPLATAAQFYDRTILRSLLNAGANPNVHTIGGVHGEITPLMVACVRLDDEIIDLLVGKGADVNFKNPKGDCAIDYLLNARITSCSNEEYLANVGKTEKIIEKLFALGATLPEDKQYLLPFWAVLNNSQTALDWAKSRGWLEKSNNEKKSPLHFAVLMGRAEMAKKLIEAGASVDAKDRSGRTPLMEAQEMHMPSDVSHLISAYGAMEADALKKDDKEKAKHWAAQSKLTREAFESIWKSLVEMLIANGADINAQDEKGRTALDCACRTLSALPRPEWPHNDRNIRQLLEKGADMLARDAQDDTPFAVVIKMGHADMAEEWAKALVAQGHADAVRNCILDVTWTAPEHPKAVEAIANVYKKLIPLGADPNAQDEDGQTPLIIAAATNQEEMCEALIELGADPNLANAEGETPAFQAIANNRPNVTRILFERGANPYSANNEGEDLVCVAYRYRCVAALNQIVDAKRAWDAKQEPAKAKPKI